MLSPDRMDVEAIVAEPYGHLATCGRNSSRRSRPARRVAPPTSIEDKYETWATYLIEEGIDPATMDLAGPAEGMEKSYDEILTVLAKMGIPPDGLVFRGSDSYMAAADVPVESEGAERIIEAAVSDDERVLCTSWPSERSPTLPRPS